MSKFDGFNHSQMTFMDDTRRKLRTGASDRAVRLADAGHDVSCEPTVTNTDAAIRCAGLHCSGGSSKHKLLVDGSRQSDAMPVSLAARLDHGFLSMPARDMFVPSHIEIIACKHSHQTASAIDDANRCACDGLTKVTRVNGLGPIRVVREVENIGVSWYA